MKLTHDIKRMLNALAYANAGDNLNRRQKARVVAGSPVVAAPAAPVAAGPAAAKPRAQVGLYLGSEISAEIMQYVVQTCSRLRHGLMVLSFQPGNVIEALLAPYQSMFEAAGIELQVVELTGEPPAALSRALRRRPEIAFLVCNESGYFGRHLLNNAQRNTGIPIPVVLVAANEGNSVRQIEPTGETRTSRAA
ncbi:MAG: hypothetical protein AB1697_00350 [Pseudomonadota bacterium]